MRLVLARIKDATINRSSYIVDVCSILLGNYATGYSSKSSKESLRLTIEGFSSQSNIELSVTGERIKAEKILCSRKVKRR